MRRSTLAHELQLSEEDRTPLLYQLVHHAKENIALGQRPAPRSGSPVAVSSGGIVDPFVKSSRGSGKNVPPSMRDENYSTADGRYRFDDDTPMAVSSSP